MPCPCKQRVNLLALWLILACCLCALAARADTDLSGQTIYRIMCVGDITTAGTTNSPSYQYPLWEKLLSSGYLLEFIGTQKSDSRIGPLKNEAYPGQTADMIVTKAVETFRKQPADIVLLDLAQGHADDETMVRSFRETNPRVAILIARPARTPALVEFAHKLNTPDQPVILVKQADSAGKMADRWFAALTKILAPPKQSYHPKIVVYKKASGADLTLHIFKPSNKTPGPHPAIVFFFGGGWKVGTPIQFYGECAYFAEKGFVAISADYRTASVTHTTPFESVADGKSAIRWIRAHAKQLDLDPDRIIAGGASAGGHVAAATATVKGLNDPADDLAISPRPNALMLWYAVIDNGPGGYGHDRIKDLYPEISPMHNIDRNMPPTLFFLGTKDSLIPVATAAAFKARIDKAGGRCDLMLFENGPHGLADYRKGDSELRRKLVSAADDFLASLGIMPAPPK